MLQILNKLLFLGLLLLMPFVLTAITLSSQADVDNFNPNITELVGDLTINSNDGPVTNLNALSNLTYIEGNVRISNCNITNLNGLNNITTIKGSLSIGNCDIIDMTGLENLASIRKDFIGQGGTLSISDCNVLESFMGLNSLVSLMGNLTISDCDILENLEGLENLMTIGDYLKIRENNAIQNLNGATNLTVIDEGIEVSHNEILQNLNGLENLISLGGFLIEYNPELQSIGDFLNITMLKNSLKLLNNPMLENLDGLANLETIDGNFEIHWDNGLTHLNSLANLSWINARLLLRDSNLEQIDSLIGLTYIGEVLIEDNDSLQNINGLNNVSEIRGSLHLSGNALLENLDGLSNLTTFGVFSQIWIRSNPALLNIDGLLGLTEVSNGVYINNNDVLQNIDGLGNITKMGFSDFSFGVQTLSIIGNAQLQNLDGLSSLTGLGYELSIIGNDVLENIDGLSNVVIFGSEEDPKNIEITDNPLLENIDGLSGVVLTRHLTIAENDRLNNLNGLINLQQMDGNLTINDNPFLTNCCGLKPILSTTDAISGAINIHDNPFSCSNEDEIVEECEISILSGFFFYDENENGIMDTTEFGLNLQSVAIEPQDIINFSRDSGQYIFYTESGTYTLNAEIPTGWYLTSDSLSYTLTVQDELVEGLNFGFFPLEEINEVLPSVTSSTTRCFREVPFWLNFQNTGTVIANGQISFELDSLTTFVSANPAPDTIIGHLLTWNYETLPPTYNNQIDLVLQMPDVDHIGDTLQFQATTSVIDSLGNEVTTAETSYSSVLACAYDPNDKQVFPAEIQEEEYLMFGQTLEYTIRFQNTGTDTAFTVRVTDQLDANLDWSTFQPLHASHSFEASLSEMGLVTFLFKDILLPDENTDEIGSNGYFKYKIQLLDDLETATQIKNTANIYFDFNPPIITNTTITTIKSESLSSHKNVPVNTSIQVFPNPFTQHANVSIGDVGNEQKVILIIRNILGRIMEIHEMEANTNIQVGNNNLAANLYFYELRAVDSNVLLGSGKIIKK